MMPKRRADVNGVCVDRPGPKSSRVPPATRHASALATGRRQPGLACARRARDSIFVVSLSSKVQTGLDENRMLVLGCQVLMGVQFRAFFEQRFEQISPTSRAFLFAALVALNVAFALLLTPAAFHRLVFGGEDSPKVARLITWFGWGALLPFVAGLTLDFYVASRLVVGRFAAALLAGVSGVVALGLLHGLEAIQRQRRAPALEERERMTNADKEKTPLEAKVHQVMTEARIILPGAQAVLGFQFITVLTFSFAGLPHAIQVAHLISLFAVALAVILLLAPASYHRIVERGENTKPALRFASRMVIGAMVPLSLGIVGDFFVIAWKIFQRPALAGVLAGALLAFIWGLWFGLTLFERHKRNIAGPIGMPSEAT